MLIYFPEIFVDGSIVITHAHVPSLRKFLHLFGQNVNDISLILFLNCHFRCTCKKIFLHVTKTDMNPFSLLIFLDVLYNLEGHSYYEKYYISLILNIVQLNSFN